MIDFLLRAIDWESFEALAQAQGFLDEEGQPVAGVDLDPPDGAGIPVAPPEDLQGEWLPGLHLNLRVSGEMEQAQIEGLEQENKGELLPLRSRTKFGQAMALNGTEWVGENGTTTGLTAAGVTFIDPESVATQQRVWQ